MIQWKLNICILQILFSYLLFYINCQIDIEDEFKQKELYYQNFTLEPGKAQMKYLKDTNRNPFIFKDEGISNDLLVNFYSLSCIVELKFSKESINDMKLNENIVSMRIKKELIKTSDIIIKEKIQLINGINKYSNKKNCPLIINTIDLNNLTLLVEENEPTILYFDKKYLEIINISYNVSTKNSNFLALSFSFNDVSKFNINIADISNTIISNSTTIFLDSDSLKKIKGDTLNIRIEQIENNYPCSLTFQIIKSESIYILQRNYINKGFITSKDLNQYYFMEVFQEEGEIMLHSKRNNGKLFGYIKPKNQVKSPYNISEYLKEENDNELEFNRHTQKLSFNSGDTKNCKKGCYLFLTYENENINNKESIIGYEYTLLARIWDVEEFSPQIINIPFNEYIFGTFEDNSFINHYYSFFIPQGIEQMIIQIESNYIEGFFGDGKKKLITFKNTENNLNLTSNEMIIKLPKDKLNQFNNNEISFAFRAQNFFEDTFSFYYFRVLILKENDNNLIYPLDSNIGNICLPEKDKNEGDNYYCYALLSNNYNDFNLRFSVSTSNQKDNYNIYLYRNYSKEESIPTKHYISKVENEKYLQSILFKFEFKDNLPKTILSMLDTDKDIISPKFYSSQIYILFNSNKEFNFDFNYGNCLLIFKYISGSGTISFDKYPKIEANLNYFGKPITIPISKVKNITFKTEESFIYHLEIKYIRPKSNIKELIIDESRNELLFDTQFPIYYYIKYNNKDNIDINFRIINLDDANTTTNLLINGYMINNKSLERKLNGEFIELTESIKGQYDKTFKNGILQINETIVKNYIKNIGEDIKEKEMNYILIKIDGQHYIGNYLSVEIIAMSNNNGKYLVPVNQYINGYNLFNNTKYLINNDIKDNNYNSIIIEFSPNYKDLRITLDNLEEIPSYKENMTTGIQKYIINTNNKEILLNINKPEGISNGNCLFRYYFLKNNDEFDYKFNKNLISKKKMNDENNEAEKADICFKFNKLEIYHNEKLVNYNEFNIKEIEINNKINNGIRIKIHGALFKKRNNNNEANELLNTSSFISSVPSYENNTEIKYIDNNNNFELCFMNMNKTDFIFDLQIKINIIFNDYFFKEDSLVYTLPIDLTNELGRNAFKEYLKKNKVLLITIIIIIVFMVIFIILYFKMKRKNKNLENQVLSISLTSRSSEELFSEYSKNKKTDPDYDNAFI